MELVLLGITTVEMCLLELILLGVTTVEMCLCGVGTTWYNYC